MKFVYPVVSVLVCGLALGVAQAVPSENLGAPGGLAPVARPAGVSNAEQEQVIQKSPGNGDAAQKAQQSLEKAAGSPVGEKDVTTEDASDKVLNQ
ncbi:MAG: hypothetical protein P1U34_00155 [Coxiellaceae bacterium]|nr:hypothetical protein [Coxiellaceae bacterium]